MQKYIIISNVSPSYLDGKWYLWPANYFDKKAYFDSVLLACVVLWWFHFDGINSIFFDFFVSAFRSSHGPQGLALEEKVIREKDCCKCRGCKLIVSNLGFSHQTIARVDQFVFGAITVTIRCMCCNAFRYNQFRTKKN